MDGKLLHTMKVETKPSGLGYFDPYSEEQMRLFLPQGDHVFRVGFLNDTFAKDFHFPKDAYDKKEETSSSMRSSSKGRSRRKWNHRAASES